MSSTTERTDMTVNTTQGLSLDAAPRSDPGVFKLPGAASLYEQLDKLVLVCLRDGRFFYGWLRSFDQYANLTLDNTVERLASGDKYTDISVGIFVIRGENVMLLGEVNEEKEMEVSSSMTLVSEKEMKGILAEKREQKEEEGKRNEKADWPIFDEFFLSLE